MEHPAGFEVVLFDLGNVLARWDPVPRLEAFARRSGHSIAGVRDRLALDDFWDDTDRGRYSADAMVDGIRERLGCSFAREELLDLQALSFDVEPEILAVRKRVVRSARVGILTNNAPLLAEALPIHFPQLVESFDPILFSYQFERVKPDPELFAAVTEYLDVAPGAIFFVDDTPGHVEAAREAGWDAEVFASGPQLLASLSSRGLVAPEVSP